MKAIFKREMRAYFTGPIAYVFIAIFAFLSGLFFYMNNLKGYMSNLAPTYTVMLIFLIILIPLMTMRLWSEEKKQKTDQLLLTAPVSTTGVVLGKFFAALCVFLVGLAVTLVFPILVAWRGVLEVERTIGNYVGLILAAAAFISISLFVSSLTKSQIISAVFSILILALFYIMDLLIGVSQYAVINSILAFFSMITRYYNLVRGIFAFADVFYYLSITVLFIFLTSRVIEKQRWS